MFQLPDGVSAEDVDPGDGDDGGDRSLDAMPPLSPISRETADQAGLMARCVSDSSLRRTSLHLDLDPSSSSPTSLLPTSPTSKTPLPAVRTDHMTSDVNF